MEDKGLHLKKLKNKITQDSTHVTQSLIGYRQLFVGLILIIFLKI